MSNFISFLWIHLEQVWHWPFQNPSHWQTTKWKKLIKFFTLKFCLKNSIRKSFFSTYLKFLFFILFTPTEQNKKKWKKEKFTQLNWIKHQQSSFKTFILFSSSSYFRCYKILSTIFWFAQVIINSVMMKGEWEIFQRPEVGIADSSISDFIMFENTNKK